MLYNVHLYREMRLYFPGVTATTPEQAATIAANMLTEVAEYTEDCDGENLAALIDVVGDNQFEQSVTIDFEGERLRKPAPELLTVLESALEFLRANDDGEEDVTTRIATAEAVIA